MSKYSYTYNRNAGPKPELRYYTRDELELMTTYQLLFAAFCDVDLRLRCLDLTVSFFNLIFQICNLCSQFQKLLVDAA